MKKRPIYNIVKIVREIESATKKYPGKKKFQKLVYLIENLGNVDLGFKYEIYFYGPYSSELDESVTMLIGEGLLSYHYEGNSHLIYLEEDVEDDDDFFAPDLSAEEDVKIKEIIDRFSKKTPSDLELLTTTHYTYSVLKAETEDRIVAGVQKIKGEKFSESQIKNAIHELNIA